MFTSTAELRAAIEIEEAPQLRLHAGDVRPERFDREQLAFLALAAGVADHAGGPAHHGDRPMSGLLEPPQDHQRHQVADVQAVGRRVEAGVDRPRLLQQQLRQVRVVGGLVDQSAPGEFGDDVGGEGRGERGEGRGIDVGRHWGIFLFKEFTRPLISRAISVVICTSSSL